jgi:hypothetical protein
VAAQSGVLDSYLFLKDPANASFSLIRRGKLTDAAQMKLHLETNRKCRERENS